MIIEEISIHNKKYPEQLKHIYNPPMKLYAIGNTDILNQKGIAIVGSRKATEYGKQVAFKISKELSEKGFHIIIHDYLWYFESIRNSVVEDHGHSC